MAVWVIKGGEFGEREQRMLDNDLVACCWEKLSDISTCHSREEIENAYRIAYPLAEDRKVKNHVAQLNAFRHSAKTDDVIVLTLKKKNYVAIGLISGEYKFCTEYGIDFTHTRQVTWLHQSIPRTHFDQDLIYSFGSFLGFCQVKRNDAENRIRKILKTLHLIEIQ